MPNHWLKLWQSVLAIKIKGKAKRVSSAGRLIIDLRILYQYTQGEEEGGEGKAN